MDLQVSDYKWDNEPVNIAIEYCINMRYYTIWLKEEDDRITESEE